MALSRCKIVRLSVNGFEFHRSLDLIGGGVGKDERQEEEDEEWVNVLPGAEAFH